MAIETYAEFIDRIVDEIADNGAGAIRAVHVRDAFMAMADSLLFEAGITYTVTPSATNVVVDLVPAVRGNAVSDEEEEGASGSGDSYNAAMGNVTRFGQEEE